VANSNTARNNAVNGVGMAADPPSNWISLHSADPATNGASEIAGGTYERVSVSFPPAASGTSASTTAVVNIPPNTTISHWGRWSQKVGGSFYMGGSLASTEQFSASGGTYSIAIQLLQPA
jgi:hypothetical protein